MKKDDLILAAIEIFLVLSIFICFGFLCRKKVPNSAEPEEAIGDVTMVVEPTSTPFPTSTIFPTVDFSEPTNTPIPVEELDCVEIPIERNVPSGHSMKSYERYTAITNRNSEQYKLQQLAHTGEYGIRMVGERYCVAVGTYYADVIRTKLDVFLEDGTILYCILGDVKADEHTDAKNQYTVSNGCTVEFIVDDKFIPSEVKQCGNFNVVFPGNVVAINPYEIGKEGY